MSQPPPLPPTQPPHASPQPHTPYGYPPPGAPLGYAGFQPCTGCGGGPLEEPTFTWWGGLIGHKMLGLHQCRSCRKWWVKKTGKPGGARILIYVVVGVVFGLFIAAMLIFGSSM